MFSIIFLLSSLFSFSFRNIDFVFSWKNKLNLKYDKNYINKKLKLHWKLFKHSLHTQKMEIFPIYSTFWQFQSQNYFLLTTLVLVLMLYLVKFSKINIYNTFCSSKLNNCLLKTYQNEETLRSIYHRLLQGSGKSYSPQFWTCLAKDIFWFRQNTIHCVHLCDNLEALDLLLCLLVQLLYAFALDFRIILVCK